MIALCLLPIASCCPREKGATEHGQDAGKDSDKVEPVRTVVEIRAPAQEGGKDVTSARYGTRFRDPVLEEIRERDEKWKDDQSEKTGEIRKRQEEEKERKRLEEKVLKSSLPADQVPASPAVFTQVGHLPPVAQYYTGTCWSYATTSMLESEVERIAGRKIGISEMAAVYHEYLAKAARVVQERGESYFSEGSQANAVLRAWAEHGAWPLAAFPGSKGEDERHDHIRMFRELEAVLDSLRSHDLWDEQAALAMLRVILDRHLGRPPEEFEFEGKEYTPQAFMRRVLKIDPGDYVGLMSTLSVPFYTRGEFEVPDNWWHDKSYYNVPLDEFYAAIEGAIEKGYSLVIAVDVSEPGKDGVNDAMFVPSYDIPGRYIDQLAREYRITSGATTDDHGVHLVGHAEHAGHNWFLVKDSGRSSRRGKHQGYYFVRDDYVRLKVLTITVHRDAVADLLKKFE